MMGVQQEPQGSLFYVAINLDKRIHKYHPLRNITELVDFDFVYGQVKDLYGKTATFPFFPL